MMPTNISEQLIRDEGEILHAYQDSLGYWTIGVGRLIDQRKGGGISSEEAKILLQNDISNRIVALTGLLPWFEKLDSVRQGSIVNMSFNLGIHGLLSFHRTLTFMEDGEYDKAYNEILSNQKWISEVGDRARRIAEQIKSGVWV